MSRYERRIYFERLVELKWAYATLGDDDRTVVMSVDEAVEWAGRELGATVASETTPTTEA